MRYYAMDTDVGTVRERNEDSIGVVERSNFLCLIVCDGMGGHEAGDVASQMAVEEIQKYFSFDDDIEQGQEGSLLEEALLKANDRINYAAQKQNTEGMGATAVVALLIEEDNRYRLTIAYAGDSRAYIFAVGPSGEGKVLPLTRDHNVYNDATQPELVPEEEREYLTQALGGGNAVQPTVTRSFDIPEDAVLLLCTDGLYEMLDEDEMMSIIAGKTVEQGVYNLIQEANSRQSRDNISVTIFKHGGDSILLPEIAPEEDSAEQPVTSQRNTAPRHLNSARDKRGANDPKRNPPRNRNNRNSSRRKITLTDEDLSEDTKRALETSKIKTPASKIKTKTGAKKSSKKRERQIWIAILLLIWIPVLFFFVKKKTTDSEQENQSNNIQDSSLDNKSREERYEELKRQEAQMNAQNNPQEDIEDTEKGEQDPQDQEEPSEDGIDEEKNELDAGDKEEKDTSEKKTDEADEEKKEEKIETPKEAEPAGE